MSIHGVFLAVALGIVLAIGDSVSPVIPAFLGYVCGVTAMCAWILTRDQ